MNLIRLSKEDAKREAGITYADIKAIIFIVTTVFGAYLFIQADIEAAESRAVTVIQRTFEAVESTQIEFQLDVLEERLETIKSRNSGSSIASPSDLAKISRIEGRIRRLEARQQVLDSR